MQVGNAGLIIGVVLVVVAAMAGIGFTVSKYMALTKGGDEEEGAGAGEEEGETLIGQDSLEPGGSAAK